MVYNSELHYGYAALVFSVINIDTELERQKTDLQSTHERQVNTLQDELDSCVTMIADAFDRYVFI